MWLFQQDNTSCHTSNYLKQFLGENVNLLDKCPNSLDLSPIEQMWAIVKKNEWQSKNEIIIINEI